MLMKRKPFFLCLYCLFTAFFSNYSAADSSVWKISDGKTYLYLAGTMHVLGQTDYPLPEEFDEAYQDSSHMVFETDIARMQSAEFQEEAIQVLLYNDGSTLADKLKPTTLALLKDYLQSKGIPIESILTFKPGMLLSVITMTELQSMGISAAGVDAHYFEKATTDGRTRAGLESAETQLGFMAAMGEEDPDRFVNYTLAELYKMNELIGKMRSAWKTGDMASLDELLVEPMEEEYPLLYAQLLKDRNNRWMPDLIAMLANGTVEMVLVGAAHLAGDHGLLRQLAESGYSVEKL